MLRSRKSFISLDFLIWIIIALALFMLFGGCTARYIYLNLKTDPYNDLISFIKEVAADSSIKFNYKIIRIPANKGLIGFAGGASKLEYIEEGKVKYSIDTPNTCENKNCLCFCDEFYVKIINPGQGIECDEIINCEKITSCYKFDNANFATSVYLNKDKKKIWNGGFLISGLKSCDQTKPKGPSKAVYIRRFGNTLSVCDTTECTEFEEIKPTT